MKKLSINKMNEYPTINLDEQLMIKGGCEVCEQYGYGEGEIEHLSEVVIYGKNKYHKWNNKGGWLDTEHCPACPSKKDYPDYRGDTNPGGVLGDIIRHWWLHKEVYSNQ